MSGSSEAIGMSFHKKLLETKKAAIFNSELSRGVCMSVVQYGTGQEGQPARE